MPRPLALSFSFALAAVAGAADPAALPAGKPAGALEVVATFSGAMPTGVTVSKGGRVFVNFPRWGDDVPFTVAEVKDGRATAYPDAKFAALNQSDLANCLVSVQSVVIDPADRLWILDTGVVEFGLVLPGGAKLVCVDLAANKVVKSIPFPPEVARFTSYLNDVRFDLSKGAAGVAYLTDSAMKGDSGLVVVDLATGASRRRLSGHPSTKPDPDFVAIVEGRPLYERRPGEAPKPIAFSADGIALGAGGDFLYYCPLASRRLYRVPTAALLDPAASDAAVGQLVESLPLRPFASDGLESDAQGRLYLTDFEHNAVMRRGPDGRYETIAHDPRLLWPDTLSLAADGYLYVTANQLHRQKQYHAGQDLREKPYVLFRVKTDGTPVALGGAK